VAGEPASTLDRLEPFCLDMNPVRAATNILGRIAPEGISRRKLIHHLGHRPSVKAQLVGDGIVNVPKKPCSRIRSRRDYDHHQEDAYEYLAFHLLIIPKTLSLFFIDLYEPFVNRNPASLAMKDGRAICAAPAHLRQTILNSAERLFVMLTGKFSRTLS
jgi:hypothetical protein